jgi:hypothetical protein
MIPTDLLRAAGLDPNAIDENRAGHLMPIQAEAAREHDRRLTSPRIGVAMMMFLIAILAASQVTRLAQTGFPRYTSELAIAAIVAIVLYTIWKYTIGSGVGRDIADGKVVSMEGIGRKQRVRGTTFTMHFLKVNGTPFRLSRTAYEMLDPLRTYRVYYLPRSKVLVNLEMV